MTMDCRKEKKDDRLDNTKLTEALSNCLSLDDADPGQHWDEGRLPEGEEDN